MSIPVRIASEIRSQVAAGVLQPGDRVESTRAAAGRWGCSRGTVVTAYDQLMAEGYLVAETGSGTHINPQLISVHPQLEQEHTPPPASAAPPDHIPLTPGVPDTGGIITPEWRAAWREAAAHPPKPTPPAGSLALRTEIAHHLRHMRGLVVAPERIVVTAGAREGLALLLQATGIRRLGVESPGYPSLRKVPQTLGCKLYNIPVDAHGVTVPREPLDAVLVTPSHQYPLGGSMPAVRRTELVAWAREAHALIIEDDFDSELRYTGHPLPALASLAPEHTVLLGTFSSVISPALSCGYVVVPPELVEQLTQFREVLGQPVGATTQDALARYLASGALRRHTGRMRRTYRKRRDLLTSMLGDVPGLELVPVKGGLHAVVYCDDSVVEKANAQGVKLTALRDYWGGAPAASGAVIGFGHLPDSTLHKALSMVAAVSRCAPASSGGSPE